MKKVITILAAMLFISLQTFAQAPNWLWAKSAGGSDYDYGNGIAVDGNGNSFVTGYFQSSSITFGSTTLTNAGSVGTPDIFIVKYDASGNVVWAKSAGGNQNDKGNSIAIDGSGNSYVTGYFSSSTITFDTITLTSGGTVNMFIVKYDVSGNVVWAKSVSASGTVSSNGIAVDGSSNSYVTGWFASPSITFGTTTLTNASVGHADIFIVKYDASGNVVWAKRAGGSDDDEGESIAVDGSGNSYVIGFFGSASLTFGITTLINAGASYDMFIVKYDVGGNVLWAKRAGGAGNEYGSGIAVDGSGNSFVTGYFNSSSFTFDTTTLTTAGTLDIFIVKYDSSGNVVWAKSAGGGFQDVGTSIAVDGSGNSYATGYFGSSSITFGTTTLTNVTSGYADIFIVKYDAGGNVVWAKSAGGNNYDESFSIAIDGSGNSYVTGIFASSSTTFGTTTLTNAGGGGWDIFVAKLANIVTSVPEIKDGVGLIVYPNPATTLLNIHHSTSTSPETLLITDLLGTVVYKENLTGIDNTISISTWSAGIYFYEVRSEKESARGKFVVQK